MKNHAALMGIIAIVFAVMLFGESCASEPVKEDPNFLGNYSAQKLDTMMANTIAQGKNELIPKEFQIIFYPNGNAVEMKFRYSLSSVSLTLMQEDREAMIEAMKRYIDEYQKGMLIEKNDKKKAYFGKTNLSMQWGLLAPNYLTRLQLRFEYQLIEKDKPYFILANASTGEIGKESGKPIKDGANSPAIRAAFSPVQCQHLIDILNQDALVALVANLDAEAAAFDIPAEDKAGDAGNAVEAPTEPKELF